MYICRLRTTIDKHFGSVNLLKSIPVDNSNRRNIDGATFISAGRDGVLCLWSSGGDCLSSQLAHRGAVNCVSEVRGIANSGRMLYASSGNDNLVKLWDAKRLKLECEFSAPSIARICWFHDSLITGSTTGSIRQWENSVYNMQLENAVLSENNEWTARDLTSHSSVCTDIVAGSHFVASASRSGQIIRWTTSRT
jgi:WD40 repeat protein